MSARDEDLAAVVAREGALPVPVGPDSKVSPVLAAVLREAERLRARVAELEAERHVTNEALDDAATALRANRDRIAELEALTPAAIQSCRKCGAGYTYGKSCSTCMFRERMAAETQALSARDEFGLHHDYRVPRELPESDGAR